MWSGESLPAAGPSTRTVRGSSSKLAVVRRTWGADWVPETEEVRYEALINIRPRQDNPSMVNLDDGIRGEVEGITRRLFPSQ